MASLALPSMAGFGDKAFWDYVFQLRQQAVLCDIQLCVKDDEGNFIAFPAHKLVLVSSSQYFQGCLSRDELLEVYNFDGISPHNLKVVLDFMYRQISWTELTSNSEAAVAADILKVIKHDQTTDKGGNIIEDSEGKKIMFVKVFDKDPARRQSYQKSSTPRPGRPSNRYVIHSEEELQHHWKEAKKKRQAQKAEKSSAGKEVVVVSTEEEEEEPAGDLAPEQSVQPAGEVAAQTGVPAPDVSQLSLLADASMVQNREAVTVEQDVVMDEASPQEESAGDHTEDTQGVQVIVPEEEQEEGNVSDDSQKEPGEISYITEEAEDGEVIYKTPVTRRAAASAAAGKPEEQTPRRSAEPRTVTRSRSNQASTPRTYTRSSTRPTPETPTAIDVPTPMAGSSPYGTRRKRVNLPESLLKTKKVKVERDDAPETSGQLHSMLVSGTSENDEEQTTDRDGAGMAVHSETHVELIVKGEPEDEPDAEWVADEEEDEDAGSDVDYALPRRGKRTRVGRLKTRSKEAKNRPAAEFECSTCNKTFKNITGLRNHNNWKHGTTGVEKGTHAGSGEHTCDICNRVLRSYAALSTHKLKIHNIQLRLACNICGETFLQRRVLKAHQHKMHGVEAYKCDQCGATFQSREGWKIHMYKQHSADEPSEMCQLCGKIFKMRHELRNHLKYTHSTERNHKCHLCDRAFKLASTLKRHIQTFHSKLRNFECDVCHCKFKTRSDLLKHRGLHFREEKPLSATDRSIPDEQDEYKCRFCDKVFEKRYRLRSHEKIVHLEKQEGINYICTICNKSFAVKHYLMAHIAQKHRPRRYKCSRCQYEFSQPYMLRKHVAKCKGYPISAKPFKCPDCGRSFNLKGNLTKHMQLGRCERARNEIVDYVVVVQQEGNPPEEMSMANTTEENTKAAQDLELQASQALQEMHGAAQIQGMQELQVETSGVPHSHHEHTEEIVLEGEQHTVTRTEDGTVILHMMDPGEVGEGQVLHDPSEQEVQTTILEIHDQENMAQDIQGSDQQVVEIEPGMEHLHQGYQIEEDQQDIIVQIIQAADGETQQQ